MRDENMAFMRSLARKQGYKELMDFSEFICNDRSVIFPSGPVPKDTWWNKPDGQTGPADWEREPDPWAENEVADEKTEVKEVEAIEGSSNDDYAPKMLIGPGKNLQPGATTDDCWNFATKRYNCPNQNCL